MHGGWLCAVYLSVWFGVNRSFVTFSGVNYVPRPAAVVVDVGVLCVVLARVAGACSVCLCIFVALVCRAAEYSSSGNGVALFGCLA